MMFLCAYAPVSSSETAAGLLSCADTYATEVEVRQNRAVIFEITALRRIYTGWNSLISEIRATLHSLQIDASLAIARTPQTAFFAAVASTQDSIVTPGREPDFFAAFPVTLFPIDSHLLHILSLWGIRTCGQFLDLPADALQQRFGPNANLFRQDLLGTGTTCLIPHSPTWLVARDAQLDDPVETLESLLSVVSPLLSAILQTLIQRGMATDRLEIELVGSGRLHIVQIPLASANGDRKAILKLIQMAIESDRPPFAIHSVRVLAHPAKISQVQHDFFRPSQLQPQHLESILSRLNELAGHGNVGIAVPQNTYRPDRFNIIPFDSNAAKTLIKNRRQVLAFRRFRPPLLADIRIKDNRPFRLFSKRLSGTILRSSGPWNANGDWWSDDPYDLADWDIELQGNILCQLTYDLRGKLWRLNGYYD